MYRFVASWLRLPTSNIKVSTSSRISVSDKSTSDSSEMSNSVSKNAFLFFGPEVKDKIKKPIRVMKLFLILELPLIDAVPSGL